MHRTAEWQNKLVAVKDRNGYGLDPNITPERIEKLVTAFGVGCAIEDAAAYAAVAPRTLHRWLSIGAQEDADPVYKDLLAQITQARGQGVVHSHGVILESKEWQAHAKRLAILRPEAYSERRFEHRTVDVNHHVHIAPEALQALDDDEIEILERFLEKMQAAKPPVLEGRVLEAEPGG